MTNKSKVTILQTKKDRLATKKFVKNEDGSITKVDYNAGKYFKYNEETVSSIYDLSDLLLKLADRPHNFIILGQIKEGMDKIVRRKCKEPGAAFDCVPRNYIMLDIDKVDFPEHFDPATNPDEIVKWVQATLPKEFNDVTCHYQFSASQNVPYTDGRGKGKVSLHLWYYCNKPISCYEWKRYFQSVSSPVDLAIFNPVQPHFTANPIFGNMPDSLPNRSGLFKGSKDVVSVPEIPEDKKAKYVSKPLTEVILDKDKSKKAIERILPHYKDGKRNDMCGAFAGALYRNGVSSENVVDFVYQLAEAASDEEINSRCNNALKACASIDNNFPVPGIPTLKELGVVEIDEILSDLGIGDFKIEEQISKLNNNSNISDIKNVMCMFLHLSKNKQKIYIDAIKDKTKKNKATLDAIFKEIKREQSLSLASDTSDIAMEEFLAEKYLGGDNILKAPDSRFYSYNGNNWVYMPDNLVKKEILPFIRTKVDLGENDRVSRNLNESLNILSARVFRSGDPFGHLNPKPKPIINCLNGEVHFDKYGSATLKPHRADSYLRNCLNVKYNPNATSPMFDEAVLDIFSNSSDPQDMFRHFCELAGYICQPSRKIPVILLFHGGGSNGKTSLVSVIRYMLGKNTVMSDRLESIDKQPFKIGALESKYLLLDDDVDVGTCLPAGFLKKASGGTEMTGQHKFKPPFEFHCKAIPLMLANDYPVFKDLSHGLDRRIMVTPFKRTFAPHEIKYDLFDQILERESSGILNHFVHGFESLKKRGKFLEPQDCIDAKSEWIVRANILTTYIDEECEKGETYKLYLSDFYESFKFYCDITGVRNRPSRKTVKARLLSLGYKISLLNGKDAVWGLKVKRP